MPFDYGAYQAKCNTLSTEQLQKEWENYTRQIAGGATSTATSVLLSPATAGISLIGLGLSAPRIHNARKKREIIEAGLKARGTTHNTRKRDVVAPMAISGVLAGATFGLAGTGADIIAGEAVGKGAEYAASHAILDVAGATIEHKHDEHLKKKGEQKLQAQYQNFQVQYAQQQAGFQGMQTQFTGYQPVMQGQTNPQAYQMAYIAYQGPQMAGQQTFVQSTQAVQYQQVQPAVQYQQVQQPIQYQQVQQAQQEVKYEYVPVPAPQQNLQNQTPQTLANQYQPVSQPDSAPPQYQQYQQPAPQIPTQSIQQEQQKQQQSSMVYASIQTQINIGSTSTPPPPPTVADMSSYYPPEKTPAYTTALGGNPNITPESSSAPVPQKTFAPTPAPPVVDQTNQNSPPLPPSFIQELPGDYFGASDAVTVEVEEVEEALASLTMEEEILLLKARLLQMELEKRKADAAKLAPNEPNNLDTSQNHANLNPTHETAPQSPPQANSAEQHQLLEHAPPPVPAAHPASPPPSETVEPEIRTKPQAPHRQSTAFTWNVEAEVITQVDNSEQHQLNSHAPPPPTNPQSESAVPPAEPHNQQSTHEPQGPSQAFIWNTESPFQPRNNQPDLSQQHQYNHHAPPPSKNDTAHVASSETNKPETHTNAETLHRPSQTPALNTQTSTQRHPMRQNTDQTHQYTPYTPSSTAEEHPAEEHKPNSPPSTTMTTLASHYTSQTHQYSAYSPPAESVTQPEQSSIAQQKPPSPSPIVSHLFSSAPPPKQGSPPIVTALLANPPQAQSPSTTINFAPTPAPPATTASPPPTHQHQSTPAPISTHFAPTPAPLHTEACPQPASQYQQSQTPPVFTTPQYAPQQNIQQINIHETNIQQTNVQQTNIQQTNLQQQIAPQPISQQNIPQQNTQQAPTNNGVPIHYQQQQSMQSYAPAPSATPAPYLVSPMSSPMPQYSSLNQPPPSPCVSPQPLPGQGSYQPYNYPKPPTQRQDSGYFSQHTASLHPTRTNSSISSFSSIMSPSAMSPQTPAQHYRQGSIQFQQPGLTMSPAPMTPQPTGQMYFPPPPPTPAPASTKRFFAQTPAPQQQYQPAPQAQFQPAQNSGYGQPVVVQQVQELQWAPHMANTNPVEPNYGPPPPVPSAWKG